MEEQNNIVIIGGTACGPKAAARARRCDPKAKITLIEQGSNLSTATCGFPYYISGIIESREELVRRKPDFFKDVMEMNVLTGTRAVNIDRESHRIEVLNLDTQDTSFIPYDKLVIATGSVPLIPKMEGTNLKGIFPLTTLEDTFAIQELLAVGKIKKATIVGAGLIGMEMAEAFSKYGLDITVVEAINRVLPALLDFEMAARVEKQLCDKGINLVLGQKVLGFEGDSTGTVNKVITENTVVNTELVLLALGFRPNVELARKSGIRIGNTGGIEVNHFLQTNDPDIYAGGDCVENTNRITGKPILAPMGSTANKHGRIIGTNVTGGKEEFPGVLGTAIVKVFDCNVARTGLNEKQANEEGYEVVTCLVPGSDIADYYPGKEEILIKLVAEKSDGKLLGGQIVGPGDAAKRIDVLSTAITFGTNVDDVANLDLAYAPPFNNAMDTLHNAANVIRNKQTGIARTLTPMQVKAKMEAAENFIFMDVRSHEEWNTQRIEASQAMNLPLNELISKVNNISKESEIVTLCRISARAYKAQRMLNGAGFENVKFLDGSIAAWPYEINEVE